MFIHTDFLLQDNLTIYGVFDGHAGPDVAVTVSHELPHRIKVPIQLFVHICTLQIYYRIQY